MNIIDEKVDIKEMYEYQSEELNSEEYKEYLKYLNFFFSKDNKKDKYSKDFLDGKYILIDKQNPSKQLIITPSEFINIHKLFIELKKYSEIILSKISNIIESKNNITEENRKEFDYLKNKYVSSQIKLKNIDAINKTFYEELEILLSKKIEKSNELTKYYQKREYSYLQIENMIPESVKNKLIVKWLRLS